MAISSSMLRFSGYGTHDRIRWGRPNSCDTADCVAAGAAHLWSSPLITLARVRNFELLHEFYGQIQIPREVPEEVIVVSAGLPGAGEVRLAPGIEVRTAYIGKHGSQLNLRVPVWEPERRVIFTSLQRSAMSNDSIIT